MIEVTVHDGANGPNLGAFKLVALPSPGDHVVILNERRVVHYVLHHAVGREPGPYDLQAPIAQVIVSPVRG